MPYCNACKEIKKPDQKWFIPTKSYFSRRINRFCWPHLNLYLKGPRWWSCPAVERIPWGPTAGKGLGSWAGRRSSCARWGYVCSTRTRALSWTPGPGTQDLQTCQISKCALRGKNKYTTCTLSWHGRELFYCMEWNIPECAVGQNMINAKLVQPWKDPTAYPRMCRSQLCRNNLPKLQSRIQSSEGHQTGTWRQSQLFCLGTNPPPAFDSSGICDRRVKDFGCEKARAFILHTGLGSAP